SNRSFQVGIGIPSVYYVGEHRSQIVQAAVIHPGESANLHLNIGLLPPLDLAEYIKDDFFIAHHLASQMGILDDGEIRYLLLIATPEHRIQKADEQRLAFFLAEQPFEQEIVLRVQPALKQTCCNIHCLLFCHSHYPPYYIIAS